MLEKLSNLSNIPVCVRRIESEAVRGHWKAANKAESRDFLDIGERCVKALPDLNTEFLDNNMQRDLRALVKATHKFAMLKANNKHAKNIGLAGHQLGQELNSVLAY